MDFINYKIIQVIKKSEKAEILFAAVDGLDVPVIVKRLYEANPDIYRVIFGMNNSHIPRIYDIREQENELLIVEEYVDGKTLDIYLAETELNDIQVLELMVQLCEALEALHGCKPPVIHRDIKPRNILVNQEGLLKIIDFDASRHYKEDRNTSDTRLMGTIEYAAPEQFGYAQTDLRSDIYSAGVVFSELKMNEKKAFYKEWKGLVDKCTSFDPKNRYKNVAELKRDLQRCIRMAKRPKGKRWILPVVSGIVLGVMLIVGGLQMRRESSREQSLISPTPVAQVTNAPIDDKAILKEDRIVFKEKDLSVTAMVKETAGCSIAEVYVCELGDEKDPFSEMLNLLERECYEVSADGKQLILGTSFFGEYEARKEIVLYIVFDDGRGERLWIMNEEM